MALYKPQFQEDDGGRKAAGYRGSTGDCVTRSIAIASGRPYQEVYNHINMLATNERGVRRSKARTGVFKKTYHTYILSLGFEWVPCMQIGQGCNVHLRHDELPAGRLIARLSKHLCAVIDGVIHDTYDPSRGGTRCVYGYYIKREAK